MPKNNPKMIQIAHVNRKNKEWMRQKSKHDL
jgi:hypothetical protein